MRIKREFFNGTFKPVIRLTNEEMERAFRIKEREYLMQDIEEHIQDLYESEDISEEEYLQVVENRDAHKKIAEIYDKTCDCNVSFNETMSQAIKTVLREGVV